MKISAVDIIDASGKMIRTLKGSERVAFQICRKEVIFLKYIMMADPPKLQNS
jgi:hypothetical protein